MTQPEASSKKRRAETALEEAMTLLDEEKTHMPDETYRRIAQALMDTRKEVEVPDILPYNVTFQHPYLSVDGQQLQIKFETRVQRVCITREMARHIQHCLMIPVHVLQGDTLYDSSVIHLERPHHIQINLHRFDVDDEDDLEELGVSLHRPCTSLTLDRLPVNKLELCQKRE